MFVRQQTIKAVPAVRYGQKIAPAVAVVVSQKKSRKRVKMPLFNHPTSRLPRRRYQIWCIQKDIEINTCIYTIQHTQKRKKTCAMKYCESVLLLRKKNKIWNPIKNFPYELHNINCLLFFFCRKLQPISPSTNDKTVELQFPRQRYYSEFNT